MSQKWIDCSNTTNALRMVPTHPSCHLSDGTLVFIDFDGAYWYLKWWGHTGSPTTIFTFLGWGGASFSICRDSSNNIYVGSANFAGGTYYSTLAAFPYTGSHTWNTSITECSYAYGGGYVSTGCNALMWVNDGGGVGGAGHILWVASAYNSSTSSSELLGLVFDAGAALVGTTTVTTNTSLMGFDSSAWGICDACASFGIGSTSGIWGYGDTNSGGVVFGTWSINSSGILTKTYVGTIPASVGHISCVSQSPGNYTFLTCVSGSGYYGATCVTATTKSSTVSSGAVANMPQNMDYLSYIACNMFLDPLTANQVWVIAPGTLSGTSIPIYRLSIATGSGTPVWNTTAVLDDTFTGVYAQPYVDISVVREPVGTMVDYACDADPASGTYALFGDYVAFASAPSPPTLSTPINGQSVDVVTGVTVGGYYNSTDMQNMNAYALQIKTSSGSWQYYNASGGSLQSTIVWNTLVTQIVPGGFFQVSLSPTLVSDGNVYNWSFASQEAVLNLQGSFATPFTFTGMTAPIVSVTSPTGVVSHGQPTVTWTESLPSGSIQTGYEVVICTAVGAGAPGGTIISDSGVINSTALSAQPAPLSASGTYYAYVQVTETGGETSAWAYSAFTFLVDSPGLPTYTVVQGTDSNGVPCFIHTIQGHDNIMDQASSSLETGLGNWQCALNNTVGFGGPVNGFDSSANASHIVTEAGVVVSYSAGIGLQPCLGNLGVSGADSSSNGMNLVLTGAAPTSIASKVSTAFFQAAQLSASTYTIAGPAGAGWTNGAITSIALFTAECTYTPSAADVAGSNLWIIGRAGEWGFEFTGSGNVNVYVYNSVGTAVQVGSLGTLVAGTTYRIALCQSSTTWYTFLNGVLKNTYTTALTVKTPSAGTSFAIGGSPLSGVIDEVRISDVCRYTSGYTPATTPFANDVNTGCLYHLDFAAPAANFGETMYQSTSGNTSGPSGNNAGQGAILGTAWSVEVQISGTGSIIIQRTGSNSYGVQWSLQSNSGSLTLSFVNSAGTLLSVSGTLVPSQVSVVQGSWDGSNIRLFVNGILQGTTACTSVWPATGSGYNLAMDYISGTVTIDELRVSNIARNVANYILQTTEYVVDSNTCVLYHFDGGIVQSSYSSVDDSYSLYIISGPNGGYAIWQSYASQVIAPSSAYTIQAEFYEPGSTPAQVTVNWLTSSGAVISSADSTCTGTVGWVPCTFNASSPSTAYGVSIALEAPSGAVGALIDVIGISPGTSQPWVLGGFAGSEVCSILRSDGLYVRGAGYTTSVPAGPDWISTVTSGNCLPLSSPGQLAVLNDYESVPGIAYTFSAQLMGTGGLFTSLVSAGPITLVIPNTMWFFIDPTNPSLSLQAAVTSQTTSQYKLTGANYPLSDSATAVMPNVTSLGTYGQSGTLVTQTGSPAEWLALKTLLSNPDIKFLINPFSEGIYCTLAVADPTGGTSGAVHSTTFKGGSNVAPYRESTITYTQVGRP